MTAISNLCVVVGAGSGMGSAVARRFAADGPLLLADRNEKGLAEVRATLPADANVTCIQADMTQAGALRALTARAGSFGSLVVTAGLSPTMGDAARILQVNLVGTALVLEAFAPLAGDGSVAVCFASGAGHMTFDAALESVLANPLASNLFERIATLSPMALSDPGMAYVLSKAGVIRLAARTARTWGPKRARVLSVSPGIIDTPMAAQEAKQYPLMREAPKQSPLGRIGSPEEVAEVVHFLCSTGASWVNGCDLRVDGGG